MLQSQPEITGHFSQFLNYTQKQKIIVKTHGNAWNVLLALIARHLRSCVSVQLLPSRTAISGKKRCAGS